jgi:hypothetical protein
MTKSVFRAWVQLLLVFAILSAVYLTNQTGVSIASFNGFPVALGLTLAIFVLPGVIALAWFSSRHKFDYNKARGSLLLWTVGEGLLIFASYTVINFEPGL